jgi:hypothetical protein
MPVRSPTAFPTSATKSDVSFDVSQVTLHHSVTTITSASEKLTLNALENGCNLTGPGWHRC